MVVLYREPGIAMPFEDRINHNDYAVSYVTKDFARALIPESAAAAVVLEDFSAAPSAVRDLCECFGIPERIIARNEGDLLMAADLRAEFRIEGEYPEHVLPFRDKLVMSEAIARAGISIPEFACASDEAAIRGFADLHGFPLIVKPRLGGSSRGVVRFDSDDGFVALPDLNSQPYLVQRFCPDGVGHVDGVWTGTGLGPWRASQYVNSCLDFASGGTRLASVEIDDRRLIEHLGEFTESVCRTLSKNRPQVVHLEFFLGREQNGTLRIQFLEIAARVGGSEIPHLWREVHGYDLLGASLDIQLGRQPVVAPLCDGCVCGFLVIRPPVPPPCRVVATYFDPRPMNRPEPYAATIPENETMITQSVGYINVGATFRFRGSSSTEVLNSIQRTISAFRMECEPVKPFTE
ncbi:hypothetical protein AB0B25_31445 [Nocardia sp. NPDC049190]|uniref:ATP-grasp domain-containing protein n=1 Tax=Nocardia sp. NPDC049190 TaxID=3155650 RepID=UPI0033C52C65